MRRTFEIILLLVLFPVLLVSQERIEVTWYDAVDLGIEGRGFSDTNTPYDRLPRKAEKLVPEGVWKRSLNSAGMTVAFATDASTIIVRWKLRNPSISTPYLSSMSVAGIDLYVRHNDKWMWAATKPPNKFPETTQTFLRGMTRELREFRLYLPSYNGVEKVEIAVPKGSRFGKYVERSQTKPIVFYGTSIVQGSASSRPGMTYVAQLGRRLSVRTINLGFSGLCKMESAMADLIAELDPAVFVIDCLPNMLPAEIGERTGPLVKKLRQARPDTPIVLVENPMYSHGLWNPVVNRSVAAKNRVLAAEFAKLEKQGVKNLHYVRGERLFGSDGGSTVDGVHPTDLGFTQVADSLEPLLSRLMAERVVRK